MTLSSSQLRLISTIGMGVLVGTSLIVIIPEGIEAVYTAGSLGHSHDERASLLQRSVMEVRWEGGSTTAVDKIQRSEEGERRKTKDLDAFSSLPGPVIPGELPADIKVTASSTNSSKENDAEYNEPDAVPSHEAEEAHEDAPTFYIGLSLILGFILMFLIDKLPRHASENLQPPAPPRHISLNNLSEGLHSSSTLDVVDEESESFLQSLTPTPKQSRSLATTTGLVIHAAADGIAMGASASTSNTKLGFIIFIAIMVHKAPAAFGLTSVLLKQGLSKRAARGHLIIFSLAAPFGALSTWLLVNILGGGHIEGEKGQWWTGMLLLFSAGTFL